MSMLTAYLNGIADAGAGLITHISLIDSLDAQIGDRIAMDGVGDNPEWTSASNGTIRPSKDVVFEIPADTTVKGWRGHSAAESGTPYGGADFDTPETFSNAGEFKLLATSTGILHEVAT